LREDSSSVYRRNPRNRKSRAARKLKPVNRPSQAGGAADAELRARRKKTNAGPRGYFANPKTRINKQLSKLYIETGPKGSRFDGNLYWQHLRNFIDSAVEQGYTSRQIRSYIGSDADYLDIKRRPARNPNPAQPPVQVLARQGDTGPWRGVARFTNAGAAKTYARALNAAQPGTAVRVVT
jgi:hypothetical protein